MPPPEYDSDSELYFREQQRERNRTYEEAKEPEEEEEADDDTVYCYECGKQCLWSGDEGGYVCYWHGLQ